MSDHYHHPEDILEQAVSVETAYALVVVDEISGGTLRAKGAMMLVTLEEAYGYISAGCVDGDIIFQAREAIKDNQSRNLRYGEGSPFKDITLPCGGTIDVKIIPEPNQKFVKQACEALKNRQPAHLFGHDYMPKLKLRIIGRGAPITALARLAKNSGFILHGQSPDKDLKALGWHGFDHLTDIEKPPAVEDDAWTAVVLLFHDHSWEPAILKQALSGEAFYIGAMGSPRTHEARLENLGAIDGAQRIKGPIGLIPSMRDAGLLAVSILAEIIQTAQTESSL